MRYKILSTLQKETLIKHNQPLPEGAQIKLVSPNSELRLLPGWSDVDYFGNKVANNPIESSGIEYRIPNKK